MGMSEVCITAVPSATLINMAAYRSNPHRNSSRTHSVPTRAVFLHIFQIYRRKFLFLGRWIRALERSYEAMLEENKSTKTWKPPFGEVLKLVCPGVNTGIVFKTMQCNKF